MKLTHNVALFSLNVPNTIQLARFFIKQLVMRVCRLVRVWVCINKFVAHIHEITISCIQSMYLITVPSCCCVVIKLKTRFNAIRIAIGCNRLSILIHFLKSKKKNITHDTSNKLFLLICECHVFDCIEKSANQQRFQTNRQYNRNTGKMKSMLARRRNRVQIQKHRFVLETRTHFAKAFVFVFRHPIKKRKRKF